MPHGNLLEAMDKSQVFNGCIIKAVNASALDCRLSLLDYGGCDKRDVFWGSFTWQNKSKLPK